MSDGQFREEKAIAQWLKTLCWLYITYVIAIIDVTIIIATNYKHLLIYIPESSRPKATEKKFADDIFETSLLATRR